MISYLEMSDGKPVRCTMMEDGKCIRFDKEGDKPIEISLRDIYIALAYDGIKKPYRPPTPTKAEARRAMLYELHGEAMLTDWSREDKLRFGEMIVELKGEG